MAAQRILVLAPHTDDGEFGCGGTIARYIDEGAQVYYVAFSSCEESLPPGYEHDTLIKEVRAATAELGIPKQNLILLNFPVRRFPEHRQAILEEMVKINRDVNPQLVILPSNNDTHQDHNVIASEGFRAFKKSTMLGFEVPWNNLTFHTSCFVRLERKHLDKKIQALGHYKSQLFRSYASAEFISSLARVRGTQIGVELAEVFESIRWVI